MTGGPAMRYMFQLPGHVDLVMALSSEQRAVALEWLNGDGVRHRGMGRLRHSPRE